MGGERREINRRDFLRFRTEDSRRIVEISCQQLHINYVNLQFTGLVPAGDHEARGYDEPPPVFARRSSQQLFEDLARDLQGVDVVRVMDRRWLVPDELRVAFDATMAVFTTRGGSLEFPR